jgi:hypothetical protein
MRNISSAQALQQLATWNEDSRLGCLYKVSDMDALFSLRLAKLEIRAEDLFLESGTGKVLLHLRESAECAVVEPADLPLAVRQGFPPLSQESIRVRFPNGDLCYFLFGG